MATSGRKPHTPGSYGTDGIKTLTIDGPINAENRGITNENEKKCSIRQNRDTILGRGTEEYVLSLREGTLEASTVDWILPQPWDREWFFNRGGVFSPTQCKIADCKVALISETMQRPPDGTAFVESWGDWTDNNFEFTGPTGAKPDIAADSSKKYFNYATGGGTDSLFTNYTAVGDAFNVTMSDNNFAAVFFIKTPASWGGVQTLMCMSANTAVGTFRLFFTSGGLLRVRTKTGATPTNISLTSALDTDTYYTIVVGSKNSSGDPFCRVNGEDITTGAGTLKDISISSTANENQINLLIDESTGSYSNPFLGRLYEFYWLKSSTNDNSFLSEIEKIEGGIAWKYDTLDDLPADHEYKSDKPHGSPIKQGPNRYG